MPMRRLLFVLVAAALLGGAGYAAYRWADGKSVQTEEISKVLLVAVAPDDEGSTVAQAIGVLDLDTGGFSAVSPSMKVSIPGTSYESLSDAYPFGGGAGVSEALARARGESPLPYAVIGGEELDQAVGAAGGVSVDLPEPMSVFDGKTLYTFNAGERRLTAEQLEAVFRGAPYASAALRDRLDAELANALLQALRADPSSLDGASTDLSAEALARVKAALKR